MIKPTVASIYLVQFAEFGTNLIIDASTLTTEELFQISKSIGLRGGHLTLTNCNSKKMTDLSHIISLYPKSITLDFTS